MLGALAPRASSRAQACTIACVAADLTSPSHSTITSTAGSDTWVRASGDPRAASAAATAEVAAAALVAALASLSAAGTGPVTGLFTGAFTANRKDSSELIVDEISPAEISPAAAPPRVEVPSPAPSLSESDGEIFDDEIESSRLAEPCNLDDNLDDGLAPAPQRLSRRQQLMALVTIFIVLLQPLIAMGIVHRRYYYASVRTEKQLTLIAANSAREAALALVRWY